MGLFDIFRRKRKTEQEQQQSVEQQTQSVSEKTSVSLSETTQTQQSTSVAAVESSLSSSSTVTSTASISTSVAVNSQFSESLVTSESVTPASETLDHQQSSLSVAESEASPVEKNSDEEVVVQRETSVAADSQLTGESIPEPQKEGQSTEEDQEERYDAGLAKSRHGFGDRLNKFLANFRHVDEDFFEDLEDMMIESDVGYDMAMKLSDSLREEVKLQNAKSKQDVSNVIIQKMVELYEEAGENEQSGINFAKSGPTVIMFVGVNGAGKTTTIGKMAARFKNQGQKVLLAAADTFRAGATEQLDVWAKRDGVDIVTGPENGDPAAVVFDGVKKAKDENYDVLFVDTAGRLQNKVNLMNELAKMKRILTREIPDAPHEVLLVLDATTGQNALNQAKLFKESTDVTGIVLTKLDGTARGGIVLAIRNELHLPVKFVGLGEKVDDLQEFNASEFVYGLFKGLVTAD